MERFFWGIGSLARIGSDGASPCQGIRMTQARMATERIFLQRLAFSSVPSVRPFFHHIAAFSRGRGRESKS